MKQNINILGFTASVVLHAMVLLILFHVQHKAIKTQPKPDHSASESTIIVETFHGITQDITDGSNGESSGVINAQECGVGFKTYSGIGIVYDTPSFIITDVPKLYPAYKAGIRVGDIFDNPTTIVDSDGYMSVSITRYNDHLEHLKFKIKAEDICVKDA